MKAEILFEKDGLQGIIEVPTHDNRRLVIRRHEVAVLDIKISGTAVAVQDSGVNEENVYEWLWKQGLRYIENHPEIRFADLLITSYHVKNSEITTDWSSIEKEVYL
jgi:hypothetical protein